VKNRRGGGGQVQRTQREASVLGETSEKKHGKTRKARKEESPKQKVRQFEGDQFGKEEPKLHRMESGTVQQERPESSRKSGKARLLDQDLSTIRRASWRQQTWGGQRLSPRSAGYLKKEEGGERLPDRIILKPAKNELNVGRSLRSALHPGPAGALRLGKAESFNKSGSGSDRSRR